MSLSINWINMIPLAKTFPEIFERSMIQYLKLKVTECSGCTLKVRSNMCSPGGGGGVGGYSWEFLVGVPCAARLSKSWPDFRPKSVIVRTRFQTCPFGRKLYYHNSDWNAKKQILQIHFEFAYFSFFLTRLELKRYIHSYTPVVPSKTTPDYRAKLPKAIPVCRPKRRKNPIRWGGTYPYGLYKGVPPPRDV